ncbi:MAG: amidohydrolase [Candidatus Dormibacteraeota bacterium]|nr:amidohydrolase [Candidatus Dormibacteraeota bacterium]MBO0745324.1 amidohydrolase [Candidatus Dormibacteraeota bacterium]
MTDTEQAKAFALGWIEENRERLSAFDEEIWRYAEPAWREYRSAAAYRALLRDEGFEVEEGTGGMPTAFRATWGEGSPRLGTYAEYDAVPGNSQQVVPRRAPREGLHPWAAGHTDPHSMLGVAALTGALAARAAMSRYGIPGTISLFGEPAEKVCGSKPVHAAKGYYDGFDAFLAYHPKETNTVAWETQCGSYWSAVVTFECLEPEAWVDPSLAPAQGGSHAAARCPGAIDALCLMYTTTKYLKEGMFPHTGSWTLNEFVMVGGDATSDNLPPRLAQIQYSWRGPTLEIQERISRVLQENARHAAEVTGCRAHLRWVTRTRVGLPNLALAELTYRNLERIGPPRLPEEARAFGRELQRALGRRASENPYQEGMERLVDPEAYEKALRQALPAWQRNFTSDDYVDYTWHAPTVRLFTARPRLQAGPGEPAYPAWADNAVGGLPAAVDPGLFVAGKTMAATFVDLLTRPEALARAREEFERRTEGGVGGRRWSGPLLPADFAPPVDLPWPEYVRTERGEEWWLPTPAAGFGSLLTH